MKTKIAVVMLTLACNMRCPFCINDESMGALSWEQATGLIDRLVQEGFGIVVLGGGEPTLWKPGVFRLAEYAKNTGLITQLGSNGILLPEDFAVNPWVDRYVLPIDGVSAEVHNRMRPHEGDHFQLIRRRFGALQMAGKTLTASTVISRLNLEEVSAVGDYLEDLNRQKPFLHAWHLYNFVPEGRGGRRNADELRLPQEVFDELAAREIAKKRGFRIFRRDNMFRAKTVDFFWIEGGRIRSASESAPAAGLA
jgi:MoaA/NifB/PqqE/SkfB family radical SAM enzyme